MFNWMKEKGDSFYVLCRVLVGFLFMMHGAQKFGIWGNFSVAQFGSVFNLPLPLAYAAAIIELVGGLFMLLGLFTRLSALLGSMVMVVALFMAHLPKGMNPLTSGAELPFLYLSAFFVLMAQGAKKASLELALFKKERF